MEKFFSQEGMKGLQAAVTWDITQSDPRWNPGRPAYLLFSRDEPTVTQSEKPELGFPSSGILTDGQQRGGSIRMKANDVGEK